MWFEAALVVLLVAALMPLTMPDEEPASVADRLETLLPDLEHGRETHRQWHDFLVQYPQFVEQRPEIGDAGFHRDMVAVYDARIEVIQDAIAALRR